MPHGNEKTGEFLRMLTYLVVLIASLPLSLKFLITQLGDENYQFCLPYLACLVWVGWTRLAPVSFRNFRPLPSDLFLLILAWLVTTASIILKLPKGGYFGFILGSALGVKLLFDAKGFRKVIPVFLAALVVITPPFGLLDLITTQLQSMVVQVAHFVLIASNVLHRISGNIILLKDRPLLVAEACSGIRSLVSIISLCICFCLYKEHSWFRSLTLFGISLVVVTLLNLFRILFIVLMIYGYRLDFTMGLKHEMLGLACFFTGLMVILGTDNLLDGLRDFLAQKQPLRPSPDSEDEINNEPEPGPMIEEKPSRDWPRLGATGVLLLAVFVPSLLLEIRVLIKEGTGFITSTVKTGHLELLAKRKIPNLDGWKMTRGPEIVEDDKLLGQGVQSQFWIFEKNGLTVRTAIDEPFRGFHNLDFCYRNIGWDQKEIKEGKSADGKFRLEAMFFRPPNQRLFLMFGHVDRSGNWLTPNTTIGNYYEFIRARLSETFFLTPSAGSTQVNYQIQLTCMSGHDLSTPQQNDLRELFELFRLEIQKWPEFSHFND